jgi:hypothetical protein
MSEKRWTYYDPIQGQQFIGLYHSHSSGHVMVYHNQQVILIDFSVLRDKSYSFLLNDHVYKLSIAKNSDNYAYEFSSAEESATKNWMERFKARMYESVGLKY